MSRSVSLEINLTSKKKSSVETILEALFEAGWTPVVDGFVNYLPLNDNDMYNWTSEHITINQLMKIIKQKEQNREIVGVDLYWKNSNYGVSVLIYNSEKVIINLNINRKYVDEAMELIDFNWYSITILSCFFNLFHVDQYIYEFIY